MGLHLAPVWWEVVKMGKQIVMLIMAIAIVALVGAQTFQINDLQKGVSSQPSEDGGESNDEMMARMHPGQVKQTSSSQPSSTGMVGGC